MENPVEDIPLVIRALTQSSPDIQQRAIETYFTKDAKFTHPICRTGSFSRSRYLIGRIYRWYKIMSPRIELTIHSVAYDEQNLRLYVDISQIFRIWVVPFHSLHVSLVAVLDLSWDGERKKYLIKHQNDLYQFHEWVKFFSPFKGYLLMIVQFMATLVCVVCATLFAPLSWLEERFVEETMVTNGLDK